MQFTDEVQWDGFDFFLMGTLLLALAGAWEFLAARAGTTLYRIASGIALVGMLLLFWINAAVGLIGNEGQSVNLLYGAVLVIIVAGAVFSRFHPKGMAVTLGTAATVQLFIPTLAYFLWPPPVISWSPGVGQIFVVSAFFSPLFLIAALLYIRASTVHKTG